MTLHYTPTRQDYAAVLRIFFWQRTGTKISLAILAIAFGLILYVIFIQGTPPTIFELVWLLLPPFFVVFTFYIQPARLANQASQNEQLVTETTWEVSVLGVQITSRYNSSLMGWESIRNLLTTREYYLLLNKKNQNSFRFVPRRAFTSPEQEELFLEMVRKYLSAG